MRIVVLAVALAACGRIGFDVSSTDASATDVLAIRDVRPVWVMPEGDRIEVDVDGDAAAVTVSIDGQACGNAVVTGSTIACDAPAHTPGVVELVVTSGSMTASYANFSYVTRGAYQHGGAASERSSGVAIDALGNVYVAGGTNGALDGANAGDYDAVLLKYDASGTLQWVRQLGAAGFDYARDVAVDPVTGSPTLVGYTDGTLGATSAGGNDVFVARYSPDGQLQWVTQTGTAADDQAWDLAIDGTGATLAAIRTTGALGAPNAGAMDYAIARYDASGTVAWIRQAGSAVDDIGHSLAVRTDGTAYLVGYTLGALAGPNAGGLDLFVARYEVDGTQTWIRQRGTAANDEAHDAAIDTDGGVWVAGRTAGALDGNALAGADDVFAMQFSEAGEWELTRQYGGALNEDTYGIAVSVTGSVFLACNTNTGFNGATAIGMSDICVIAADSAGNHQWTRILGTSVNDAASSCAIDLQHTGLVFVSAITDGSLDGLANRGVEDIAVVKLDVSGQVQ